MPNRQVYPSSLFPLRGDVSAEFGATTVTVQGILGFPIQDAYLPPAEFSTILFDSTNNDFYFGVPWDIPVGQVLEFEGYGYSPVGISWLAPDTIAIGDGTQGDVSGAAAMTALILFGSPDYSYYDLFHTTIYSGATSNWSLILPENAGAPGQVLTIAGNLYSGAAFTEWATPSVPTPTTPGGSSGDIQYNNSGSFGGSAATITAAGSLHIPIGQVIEFTGSGYTAAGLSWLAADTLAIGNGTEGDVSGGLGLTALILYGPSFYSDYDLFHTTIYSGATINWNLVLPETPGTSGQLLTTNGLGFTYWTNPPTTSVDTPPQGMGFWSWYFNNAPLTLIARTALSAVLSTAGAGGYQAWMMYVPRAITISHLAYEISTTVAGGTVDFGLYKQAGGANSLVASTGGVSTASGGADVPAVAPLTQGTVTIQPGWYYFAVTSSTITTAAVLTWTNFAGTFNDPTTIMLLRGTNATAMAVFATGSSGGVLPSTMPTWTALGTGGPNWDVPAVWFSN